MHPQTESYWGHVNPIGPRGVYDEAKRYAEALTMAYHRQQGVDTAIVRIFNTYGKRMRPHDGRAIPTFLRQALANRPLTVFGDGSQTRSFCYVSDLIRGLIALAESGHHDPVNIGNPDEFTLLELGGDDQGADGLELGDRLRGAAGRRSETAQARHHARARAARLVAGGPPARGAAAHDRRLRREGPDRLSGISAIPGIVVGSCRDSRCNPSAVASFALEWGNSRTMGMGTGGWRDRYICESEAL